jgi:hypothetical protein
MKNISLEACETSQYRVAAILQGLGVRAKNRPPEVCERSCGRAGNRNGHCTTELSSASWTTWKEAATHGASYLERRRRLAVYFCRKNCLSAGKLADETLTCVGRRLEEEDSIADPPATLLLYRRQVRLSGIPAAGR